jgi:hypothetical protein
MIDQNSQEQLDGALLDAARLLTSMVNTCDPEPVIKKLGSQVKFESQSSFDVLRGRDKVADYLRGKMKTVKDGGIPAHAEVGRTDSGDPGVIIRQEDIMRTFWVPSLDEEGKISSIFGITLTLDMVRGLGEMPGLDEDNFRHAENKRIERQRQWVKNLDGPLEFTAFVLPFQAKLEWVTKVEELAESFTNAKLRVSVHDLDSSSNDSAMIHDEAQKYDILGYPAIAVVKGGEVIRDARGSNILAEVISDLEKMGELPSSSTG